MQRTRIILATHGYFAEGILSSAKIIIGEIQNVETLCCYVEEGEDYEQRIKSLLESHDYSESSLIVVTDLLGGSINNMFMNYINDFQFYLVSGLNLALLLELIMQTEEVNKERIRAVIKSCAKGMSLCNDIEQNSNVDDDF
ncbi:PTS sugar transporter subunit IIA [Dielma fastidiosa]|uniref:PTS fructose transporter subunit IIA n=1 Tax=Dielma fastidiosa TaxID=1034346 RepID=A0AB35UQJ6_9FIRM|nr:PTS fructose transporter subunit IIA [Dielma fastidiosa]MDY5169733.1 PTS fructose transporter subunit IIA [Dielma fastidiosa]